LSAEFLQGMFLRGAKHQGGEAWALKATDRTSPTEFLRLASDFREFAAPIVE